MRAVVVVDRAFGRAESVMLARLQIGLADEGYRVVHAAPVATLSPEQSGVYSTSVGYVDTGLPFTLKSRVATLVETLKALAEKQGDRGPVNIVHACGRRSWPIGLELAKQTGAAVVLEVDRAQLLGTASALVPGPGAETAGPVPMFSIPDELLRTELLRRSPRARTSLTRWGVHVPPGRHPATGAPSFVLLAERGDSRSAAAALEALASIARDAPELMVFVDVEDGKTAALWRAARRLGMLGRLSMVPELEARRDPALQMDALILPDALGVNHTFVLDAMAAGMSVLAAPDPLIETLIDGRTASLVTSPSKTAWEKAIRDTVLQPVRWSQLGASSREWVRSSRTVSAHIGAVLECYSQAQRLHESDRTRRKAVA